MKTASKVFIWIGMIFGFYLIYPVIVGIIALKKLNSNTSKSDLKEFGIITLFFCNFFGGLFMMLADNEESGKKTENATVIKYERIPLTKEELRALNNGNSAKITRVFIWSIVALTVICLILSIVSFFVNWDYNYYRYCDSCLFAFIPICILIFFLLIPVIMYIRNNNWVDKKCNIAFIVSLAPQFTLFACSIPAALMGRTFIFWIIFTLSLLIFGITLTIILLNRKILKTFNKHKIVTSRLEIALDEAKRLFDNNIVSQDEYEKIRESVIAKYC